MGERILAVEINNTTDTFSRPYFAVLESAFLTLDNMYIDRDRHTSCRFYAHLRNDEFLGYLIRFCLVLFAGARYNGLCSRSIPIL